MSRLSVSDAESRALAARTSELAAQYLAGPMAEDLQLAQRLAERIRSTPDLELLAPVALSACIVNHRTTAADVDAVVDETLAAAKES